MFGNWNMGKRRKSKGNYCLKLQAKEVKARRITMSFLGIFSTFCSIPNCFLFLSSISKQSTSVECAWSLRYPMYKVYFVQGHHSHFTSSQGEYSNVPWIDRQREQVNFFFKIKERNLTLAQLQFQYERSPGCWVS